MTLDLNNGGFDVGTGFNISIPWNFKRLSILTNATTEVGDHTISLTNYIPDDGNDYEVIWQFSGYGGNTLLFSEDVPFGGIFAPDGASARINGILPITKNRNIKYHVYTASSNAYLSFEAYRRTTNI